MAGLFLDGHWFPPWRMRTFGGKAARGLERVLDTELIQSVYFFR